MIPAVPDNRPAGYRHLAYNTCKVLEFAPPLRKALSEYLLRQLPHSDRGAALDGM
jgi:hypothetical protein